MTRLARSAPAKPAVRAATTRRSTVRRHLHVLRVDAEDGFAALHVGLVHDDLPVEPARAEQRGVEHLGPVRRRHDDDALARVEPVHLGQQLVQCLFPLFVAAHRALRPHLAQRVQLVDEHDARRLGFSLLEEIADARGADAHEHLDELRAAEAEERHVRFSGHGAREQRLAGARRADQQGALGNPPAQVRVLLRRFQELDDLPQLVLGLVDARDVGEPHLHLIVGVDLRAAAGEGHDAALGASHPAEEEPPQGHDEQHRDDPSQQVRHPAVHGLARELHALGLEILGELRILDAVHGKQLLLVVVAFRPWASACRAAIARRSSLRTLHRYARAS